MRKSRVIALVVASLVSTASFAGAQAPAQGAPRAERHGMGRGIAGHGARGLFRGIEREELDRLKGRIKRSLILQQESSPSRSGSIAYDWYYLNRVRTMDELRSIIDGLTVESINEYLAAHPPGEFTVVTLGAEGLKWEV